DAPKQRGIGVENSAEHVRRRSARKRTIQRQAFKQRRSKGKYVRRRRYLVHITTGLLRRGVCWSAVEFSGDGCRRRLRSSGKAKINDLWDSASREHRSEERRVGKECRSRWS